MRVYNIERKYVEFESIRLTRSRNELTTRREGDASLETEQLVIVEQTVLLKINKYWQIGNIHLQNLNLNKNCSRKKKLSPNNVCSLSYKKNRIFFPEMHFENFSRKNK